MNAIGFFTKDATKKGEYKKTSLDVAKESAEILVIAVSDKREIMTRGIELKGRGITKLNNNIYSVTDNAWEKIKNVYSFELDY